MTQADKKKLYILEQLKEIWDLTPKKDSEPTILQAFPTYLRRAGQTSIAERRYEKWLIECDIEQFQLEDILKGFQEEGLIQDFEFRVVNPAV